MPDYLEPLFKRNRERSARLDSFFNKPPPEPDWEDEGFQGWLQGVLGRLRERFEERTGRLRQVGEFMGRVPVEEPRPGASTGAQAGARLRGLLGQPIPEGLPSILPQPVTRAAGAFGKFVGEAEARRAAEAAGAYRGVTGLPPGFAHPSEVQKERLAQAQEQVAGTRAKELEESTFSEPGTVGSYLERQAAGALDIAQFVPGGIIGKVGRPATILKKLGTAEQTAKYNTLKNLATKKGLDLEAVEGIAKDEFWIALTPAKEGKGQFMDWLVGLRNKSPETANQVEKFLVGKFDFRETEPAYGRARFLPFKSFEDAEKFLETGDMATVAKKIELKGPPRPELVEVAKKEAEREALKRSMPQYKAIQSQIDAKQAEIAKLEELTKARPEPLNWSELKHRQWELENEVRQLQGQYTEEWLKAPSPAEYIKQERLAKKVPEVPPVAEGAKAVPKAPAKPVAPKAEGPPIPPEKPTAMGVGEIPPTKPPETAVGAMPEPEVPKPQPIAQNVIGLRPIQPGLTRGEALNNLIRRTVSRVTTKIGGQPLVEANRLANPALRERARVMVAVESNANVLGTKAENTVNSAFKFDTKGRIPELTGVDPDIPSAPTIQDVAARFPNFEAKLSPAQKQALNSLKEEVSPYKALLDEVGVEVPSRPDVMEGGFYLPRGRAALEGSDMPVKVGAGGRGGTKKGFERPSLFKSQAEGIEKGYEYAPFGQALTSYAYDAGARATDAHVVNYFKSLTDETGKWLGQTPKMRLMEQNPELAKRMDALKESLAKLKRNMGALSQRQIDVIDMWSHDPEYDDLSELLEGLATMKGGQPRAVAGELKTIFNIVKQEIRDLMPEYKVALRRAQTTPRTEGVIGLPGLQGRTYPDEIANAANKILRAQGPTTGALAPAVNTANAFNNLYRGLRATLDDSALGIQGLLGLGAAPRAYREALKVNVKAWGIGGDKVLGKFITDFDAKAAQTGRLKVSEWAREGLHQGGATSEFQLGQGVGSKISGLPVVRQANRAFGYFGDALRAQWADAELATQMGKRSLAQIRASGDLEKIAKAANSMTGWSPNKAFGSVGDLLLFAPRFLQARLETIARAGMGLRPGASLEQRMTRNSMLKFLGLATITTVGVNELLGNETDFRPIVDGRRNPNFMRINFGGHNYSLLGTWDSLAGAIINVGTGRPLNALRSMSSGIVADSWDLITGKDYTGNQVRDTPQHLAQWLMGSFAPFSAGQIPVGTKEAITGITEGKAGPGTLRGRIGGAVNVASQVIGVKSYPVTPIDELKSQWLPEIALYQAIPTDPLEIKAKKIDSREDTRKKNPDLDAKLFITNQVSSVLTNEAAEKVFRLAKEKGIDPANIKGISKTQESLAKMKELGLENPRITPTEALTTSLAGGTYQPAPTGGGGGRVSLSFPRAGGTSRTPARRSLFAQRLGRGTVRSRRNPKAKRTSRFWALVGNR